MASLCSVRATSRLLVPRGGNIQTACIRRLSDGLSHGRKPLPPMPRVLPRQANTKFKKTTTGSAGGTEATTDVYSRIRNSTPVSWKSLFLMSVAGASAVAYFQIQRERRLEAAMGQVVSSELDSAWTPNPDYMAKRKFVRTNAGWFPLDDGFGACEFVC